MRMPVGLAGNFHVDRVRSLCLFPMAYGAGSGLIVALYHLKSPLDLPLRTCYE